MSLLSLAKDLSWQAGLPSAGRPVVCSRIARSETHRMFDRRTLLQGGLAAVVASTLAGAAKAQAGKPTLVFLGHEL